ncbi:MAG: hypothetical protein ACYCYM_10870 [Saccharofermentanales bacterium]
MKQQSINNELDRKLLFLYLMIYKTIIEIIYASNISVIYSYSGLTLNVNRIGFFISTAYLLIIVLFSPTDKARPSTYLFILLEVFIFIPTLSYYWLNNQSVIYTSYIVISSVIIFVVLKMRPSIISIKAEQSRMWLALIFVLYVIASIYLVLMRGGIDSRAFDFNSIYELRSENNVVGFMGYMLNWCTKVFCPFFFVYFYYRRQKLILLLILGLQLLSYLSFGNKAFLFSIALIIICVIIAKREKFDKEFILLISGINIIAYLLDILNISDTLRRAIPYRMVFIPAQIQFYYYEFFSTREKMHFAETIFGRMFSIKSPYSEGLSFYISRYYSSNEVYANANTGIFSSAYADGGFIAMILFSIILALVFYLVDSTTAKLPLYVVIGAFSYTMFVLNDASLLTSILTGGMGITIFILLLFNSNIKECDEYMLIIKDKNITPIKSYFKKE